jgi:hypothetical protein
MWLLRESRTHFRTYFPCPAKGFGARLYFHGIVQRFPTVQGGAGMMHESVTLLYKGVVSTTYVPMASTSTCAGKPSNA